MIQGKIWGLTTPVLETAFCEVHEIKVKKGGVCSTHRHRHRWNMFYVISGELIIYAKKLDYDLVDKTILGPGQSTTIRPNEFHWFEATKATVALEVYYPSGCSPADIERENCGSAP